MQPEASRFAPHRFSTRGLLPSKRASLLREWIAHLVKVDIEPQSDRPLDISFIARTAPGLKLSAQKALTPVRLTRTRQIVAEGDDSLGFILQSSGKNIVSHLNHEAVLAPGDATLLLHDEPAAMQYARGGLLALIVSRQALAPLVTNVAAAAGRLIPKETEALRLLDAYLKSLLSNAALQDPRLQALVVTHIHDLMALALGATREAAEIAHARGARAARLAAIKTDIATNPAADLHEIAARQGVSPRYVQMLFEAEGMTFTAYNLEQRLGRAYRMLESPCYLEWTVSAIALEAGFGDLSHFNRNFRRRFGATPSDVRFAAAATRKRGGTRMA